MWFLLHRILLIRRGFEKTLTVDPLKTTERLSKSLDIHNYPVLHLSKSFEIISPLSLKSKYFLILQCLNQTCKQLEKYLSLKRKIWHPTFILLFFKCLNQCRDQLEKDLSLNKDDIKLSMGMSNDYQQAVSWN